MHIGRGFDGVNIRTALWLSGKFPHARISDKNMNDHVSPNVHPGLTPRT